MTDSKQTPEGKAFWFEQVAFAIENNHFVYRINVDTGETQRIMHGPEAFGKDTYGTENVFALYRLVISKEKLFDV